MFQSSLPRPLRLLPSKHITSLSPSAGYVCSACSLAGRTRPKPLYAQPPAIQSPLQRATLRQSPQTTPYAVKATRERAKKQAEFEKAEKEYFDWLNDDISEQCEMLREWEWDYAKDGSLKGQKRRSQEDKAELAEENIQKFYLFLKRWAQGGYEEIKNDFTGQASRNLLALGINTYHLKKLDLYSLALSLRWTSAKTKQDVGDRLTRTLAYWGDFLAVVDVLNQAVVDSRTNPSVWNLEHVKVSRNHLANYIRNVEEDNNCRILVLEAKIARALGRDDYAIECLNRAMKSAIIFAQNSFQGRDEKSGSHYAELNDLWDLTSPWIELIQIYGARIRVYEARGATNELLNAYNECERFIRIGCEQEDPLAHKEAAVFYKKINDKDPKRPYHEPTSKWLYHTLNCAASFDVQAMTALGTFYMDSGWKYIMDEPPDHLKPTPFDSGPPKPKSNGVSDVLSSLLATAKQILIPTTGGRDMVRAAQPHEELFYSEIHPTKARDRFQLASEWLKVAMDQHYAPAFLVRAKLSLEKTLWHEANAPKAALQLDESRYTYQAQQIDPATEEKNPFYDPKSEFAKSCLAQIFEASEVCDKVNARKLEIDRNVRGRKPTLDQVAVDVRTKLRKDFDPLAKWLANVDSYLAFESSIGSLRNQAILLCNDNRLDLYDSRGKMVYAYDRSKAPPMEDA